MKSIQARIRPIDQDEVGELERLIMARDQTWQEVGSSQRFRWQRPRASTALPASTEDVKSTKRNSFEAFVLYRFVRPLLDNALKAPVYGALFTTISLVTIAAGLVSSALAHSSDHPNTTVLTVLGLLISLLTGINQLGKPAQRSVARYQAFNALRREGWEFVRGRGRYKSIDEKLRTDAFVDEILTIQRGVEIVDESTADGGTKST